MPETRERARQDFTSAAPLSCAHADTVAVGSQRIPLIAHAVVPNGTRNAAHAGAHNATGVAESAVKTTRAAASVVLGAATGPRGSIWAKRAIGRAWGENRVASADLLLRPRDFLRNFFRLGASQGVRGYGLPFVRDGYFTMGRSGGGLNFWSLRVWWRKAGVPACGRCVLDVSWFEPGQWCVAVFGWRLRRCRYDAPSRVQSAEEA